MAGKNDKSAFKITHKVKFFCSRNILVIVFLVSHASFAIFLGRLFALAPDEEGYLFAFENVYTLPINTVSQNASGWNMAPTIFLWIAYLPAKILSLVGIPDYLSIRLLSIALTALSLFMFLRMKHNIKKMAKIPEQLIFLSFFIPSVFLWTSTGLREAFIIFEISLFLVGLNHLFWHKSKKSIYLLIFSSYGLVSTKPYLWALLMISVFVFSIINLILKTQKKYLVKLAVSSFIVPLILFTGTSSQNLLNYFFEISITEVGLRSGNSLSQIKINQSEFETEFTFNGDYTLISLHFYLLENPNSAVSKFFRVSNLDKKVESLWNEKLEAGLISESKQLGKETSSLNGHILKSGSITEPQSMLWPAFIFLAGPFPFIGEPGIAVKISSFESPLWWLLYTLVIYQFYKFRKSSLFRDPVILFTLIFLAGEIAFSSLVEVNLGTSFRHRSILLAPLVFLYLRIAQRAHELRGSEPKPIL
jgi:hypothetical protein